MKKELTCRYGHVCTSGCQNDFDCPCQSEHCCAFTEDCDGSCDGSCDDCYNTIRKVMSSIGSIITVKKSNSSIINGKKGGRPKKGVVENCNDVSNVV